MNNTIIQWNCRGLKANYNEMALLLHTHSPAVTCLQETFLKQTNTVNFTKYSIYNHINHNNEKASGGSSVVVDNRAPHRSIPLNTSLQAVAVNVTLHRPITICSIYIPPRSDQNHAELFFCWVISMHITSFGAV